MYSLIRRVHKFALSLLLAGWILGRLTSNARALDIWLVTNHNRILVIRDVDTNPHQEYILTHDDVPDAHTRFGYFGFGDIGFAPNGRLYAISLTLEQKTHIYTVDIATGHIIQLTPQLPFEWGNALEFNPKTGVAFTGGGLESYNPYRYLKGFYTFQNYDPATVTLWHDMTDDYPNGGYTAGYTWANGYLYAIWGQGNWSGHKTYLLQITTDATGNFVSYTNLGDAERHGVPGGNSSIVSLRSDGANLYAISSTALYSVTIRNGVAWYNKIMDFNLQDGEEVNGSSSQIADLSIRLNANTYTPSLNTSFQISANVQNAGPYNADSVIANITLPLGLAIISTATTNGTFNPNNGEWNIGTLPVGKTATLTLTVQAHVSGNLVVQAEITHAGTIDPDSVPSVRFDKDDWNDGLSDDDEASISLNISKSTKLPLTGFPPHLKTLLPQQSISYTFTQLTLEIPKLGISAPIVGVLRSNNRWDVRWLGNEVGWLEGTAFPTLQGNTVLTAHVWNADNTPGIFVNLKRLRFGDKILIHAWGLTYIYEVRENRLLLPNEGNVALEHKTLDWITLLTCEGYSPILHTYRYRRMVRAVLTTIK